MKHLLNTCVILLCIVSVSAAFANPYSKADHDQSRPTVNTNSDMVRYRPALRQNEVLFVEDKAGTFGPPTSPDPLWDSLLTELIGTGNYGWFTTLDPDSNGPDLATMEQYELIIWNCYDYWWGAPTYPAALTSTDRTNISDLLFNGGKCWLIGQDALWSGVPLSWMDTHFHLQSAIQDYNYGIDSAHVEGQNEIAGFNMTVISDYLDNPLFSDDLTPDPAFAHSVLEDIDSAAVVGIFYPGQMDWQSAFWSIDLRDASFTYWPAISAMVSGMFTAFELTGINETPVGNPVQVLQLNVSPDPFVRATTISFEVPVASHVTVDVYNNVGQHINTLIDGYQSAGSHSIIWNRSDARGADVPNGVYFVRLTCDDLVSTANVIVTR
ncbi:MAG: T9SS type A sorting domain-containing protein [candidate division WOR-3 bacterium]|nr:MAG: T9SS type A sorting domain-containing protein [candidate division WOR-3 bacterium]